MSWEQVQLKELVLQEKGSLVSGPFGSNIGAKYFVQEGVPVIRGNNLTKGEEKFIDDGFVYLTESKAREFSRCLAIKDDIVFTAAGSIGQVGIIPENSKFDEYVISNKQLRARIDPAKADPLFVYYWLSSRQMRRWLENMNNGGAVPLLNLGIVKRAPVPLPSLSIQKKIKKTLSAYDDLIENNQRRIALLKDAVQQQYKEWFVRFRFPGHEHVRIVDGIPEGWRIVSLEEVCDRITDGSHMSPKSASDGKPMASVKDMHSWGIDISSCRIISNEDYDKLVRNDCKPRLNDVLIAKDGSYLKHVFVVDEEQDLVILSSIAILRPNGKFLPNQLALYLGLPQIKERMKGYVSGVALPRIILKEFRNFKILLPPEYLQKIWAEQNDDMLTLCRRLIKQNEMLAKARDLLLPKIMSGEIAV